MIVPMKVASYFLMFLTLLSQVDAALLAIASVEPVRADITTDEDDALVTSSKEDRHRSPRHERSPQLGWTGQTGKYLARSSASVSSSESNRGGPFGSSSLSVFMSFQC